MSESRKKILMIDDETEYTAMTKLYLEDAADVDVCVLNRSRDGVDVAREYKPDIILLDISMPELSGTELARLFKADEALKDIPIIFFTGAYPPAELDKSDMLEGYPYLTKPTSGEALLEFIQKHLEAS